MDELHDEEMRLVDSEKQNEHRIEEPQKKRIIRRWYKRKGHWGLDEKAKYYLFMKSNLFRFQSIEIRRLEKVFTEMSTYVSTRSATQCRSFHQKQEKKYK